MAKLEVKTRNPRVKMAGIVPDDLFVTIDGVEIENLTALTLHVEDGKATECAISFYPHAVSINSHVLARLNAIVKSAPDGGDDGATN